MVYQPFQTWKGKNCRHSMAQQDLTAMAAMAPEAPETSEDSDDANDDVGDVANFEARMAAWEADQDPAVNGKTMGKPWENHGKIMGKCGFWDRTWQLVAIGHPKNMEGLNGKIMGKSWNIISWGIFHCLVWLPEATCILWHHNGKHILIDTMNHGKVGAPYFFPGYIISRLRPHCDDMGMATRWFPKEHDLQLIHSYRF